MKSKIYIFYFFVCVLFLNSCKEDKTNTQTNEPIFKEVTEEKKTLDTIYYSLIPKKSKIGWRGFKLSGSHTGRIRMDSGTLKIADGRIVGGEISIDMTTIDVRDLKGKEKESLENHLKGLTKGKEGDFFNVSKYPKSKYIIIGSTKEEDETLLEGDLELVGTTNPVEPFNITLTENKNIVKIVSDVFYIDRTEWGIRYGSKTFFEDIGDNLIKDEIRLKIEASFKLIKK